MKSYALAIFLFATTPIMALAQSDDLRAQIRADLLQDPQTAEMAPAELDALVDALAAEAEATGAADTYLDAQSAPAFTYEPPPVSTQSPYIAFISAPIVIALLALLVGIALVLVIMFRRRQAKEGGVPVTSPEL